MSAPGVLYNDRVFVAGQTQSGKSEFLNYLFGQIRSQRLLVDSKDEFTVADVEPARDVDDIDWAAPIIHYIDADGGAGEFDKLFEHARRRRRLTIFVHELADLCEHKPGKAGRHVNAYATKGAAHGQGLVGGSQRPVNVPMAARTEAQHVFTFVPRFNQRADMAATAEPMGLSVDELHDELAALLADHGPHSFLWWDLRAQQLTRWPPLPENMLERGLITRRTVA